MVPRQIFNETWSYICLKLLKKNHRKPVIKVVGVGGCGGNAVDHMIEKNVMGVEFICINTDLQALKKSQASSIVQIGELLNKRSRCRFKA